NHTMELSTDWPDAIAAHLRRADLLIRAGRNDEALADVNLGAEAAKASGDPIAAAGFRARRALLDEKGTSMMFRARISAVLPSGWTAKEQHTFLSPHGDMNVIVSSEPVATGTAVEVYGKLQGDLLT